MDTAPTHIEKVEPVSRPAVPENANQLVTTEPTMASGPNQWRDSCGMRIQGALNCQSLRRPKTNDDIDRGERFVNMCSKVTDGC